MARFFKIFFALIRFGIRKIIDSIVLRFPIYYTRIDKISIARWFDVINGDLSKLYKVNFIDYIPIKFVKIAENMYFQLDKIDTSIIQKEAEIALLNSLAARTKNKVMQFNAESLRLELNKKKLELSHKSPKLNDFLNYIELTLNKSVDPEKTSASRAFSLYHLAVERNKMLENGSN